MIRLVLKGARPVGHTDAEEIRRLAVSATDGIVAAAGIAQGLNVTDQPQDVIMVALVGSVVAGGLGAASAMYHEYAWERDAIRAALHKERLEHELHPEAELQELAAIYEERGLEPALARRVAEQLSRDDPVRAHVREELGFTEDDLHLSPLRMSITGGLAFVVGAFVPLLSVLLVPDQAHTVVTFASVVIALLVTSAVVARSGHASVLHTVVRTLAIGIVAMSLSMIGGTVID
ncbi:VIT1/CCC1 transporter family protein [Pseudoclavibacter sp. CFCC 11306]|uniref:VIT1/CCC1 transporter family protein n=1 Tax=Pseudoclavibacter sp. CFCC 11306 TaxID=1564493 RepID=UPI0013018052|nr:VIT1/CCC1 transporter family protein [Pseudoclavibacter sp. CFCC 11306]KAB1658688.1 VIT family protein [Pseudoclavibacter sp. CFCC 11306]